MGVKHIAIVIDWFGPYTSVGKAVLAAKRDYADGLYLVLGKARHQKKSGCLQYIGIAKNLALRVQRSPGVEDVTRERKIWLGAVSSVGIPGRRAKVIDTQIDLAEWAHAYFLRLPLNVRKKVNPPPRPMTVVNRWWRTDYETPYRQRPHRDWPDVIDFLGRDYGCKVAWFGSRRFEKWYKNDMAKKIEL